MRTMAFTHKHGKPLQNVNSTATPRGNKRLSNYKKCCDKMQAGKRNPTRQFLQLIKHTRHRSQVTSRSGHQNGPFIKFWPVDLGLEVTWLGNACVTSCAGFHAYWDGVLRLTPFVDGSCANSCNYAIAFTEHRRWFQTLFRPQTSLVDGWIVLAESHWEVLSLSWIWLHPTQMAAAKPA